MILVTGATGPTGSAATRLLLDRGEEVRVLTRSRERAEAMPELDGAEIRVGDCSDVGSVDGAFDGAEKVYLIPPLAPGWNAMQAAMIDAARRAGVRHLVRISAIGASAGAPSMSLSYHWQGERELEASGVAYTHLRGNSFFQNTLYEAESIKTEDCFYDCVGDARFAKVDSRDIGAVVAVVLTEDGHEGRTYELTGPEPLTYAEMAERLGAAVGREIRYVDLTVEERAARLVAAGYPDWLAAEFSSIYGRGFYRASGGSTTTGDVEQLLGRPPRTWDDFARDYAGAFAA